VKIACQLSLNPGGTGRFPHLDGHPERTHANAIGNRRGRVSSFLSRACAPLPEPSYWPLRPLFLTSSDKGRQYDHDRRDTCERNAHDRAVVKLFLFFDRRPSFLTQGDVLSRLLCENPVVRDKNFRLVTSLALVSTKGGSHALKPLAATHVQARQRRASSHPMPNVSLLKEPPTRKLSVNARCSNVWTVFWSFVVRAEKVGCRFCGTFCALVDAMLP